MGGIDFLLMPHEHLDELINAGFRSCAIMQDGETVAVRVVEDSSLVDEKTREQFLRVNLYLYDLLLREAANFEKEIVRNILILEDQMIVLSPIKNNTILIAHSNLDEKTRKLSELEQIIERLRKL